MVWASSSQTVQMLQDNAVGYILFISSAQLSWLRRGSIFNLSITRQFGNDPIDLSAPSTILLASSRVMAQHSFN
jgi:hypothetical protein